jgi:hypothetical protein
MFYRIGHLAWRFEMSAAFIPAIPVVILVWWCPGESSDTLTEPREIVGLTTS